MNRDDEKLLARVVAGSASAEERAELERRAARDPALADAVGRWSGAWRRLGLGAALGALAPDGGGDGETELWATESLADSYFDAAVDSGAGSEEVDR